ncbi:MAG: TonB-dependent receptor [Colwellia sp.]|nr:TonB-dependent receptor [Colwellia sp.]
MKKGNILHLSALSIAVTLAMQPVLAVEIIEDEKNARAIEKIVVTAQKREQYLQSTPLTIDVFSGDQIEKNRIESVQNVANLTPGLSMDAFPSSQPRPFIRGVGSADTGAGGDQSTAVYVDEIYMSRPAFLSFDYFDLQRIEVLKGPQGTLWGKNVVGGLIHVITNKADSYFDAKLQATVGNDGIVNTNGMINVPLIENKLFSRFVISASQNDGFAKNINTGSQLMSEDRLSGRAHFLLKAMEDLELGLSFNVVNEDNTGSARNLYDGNITGLSTDPDNNNRITSGEIDGFDERDIFSITATAKWSTERADINITANHKELEYAFNEDFDGTNLLDFAMSGNSIGDPLQIQRGGSEETESNSLEVRISGDTENDLFWQAGIFYEKSDINQNSISGLFSGLCAVDALLTSAGAIPSGAYAAALPTLIAQGFGFPTPYATAYGLGVASGCDSSNSLATPAAKQSFHQVAINESYAIFGELSYPLSDIYTLTAGSRYSTDQKDYTVDSSDSFMGIQLAAKGTPNGYEQVNASDDWDAFTWKLTLDAQFDPDLFGYATVSTGYKAGGFQDGPLTAEDAAISFDPEHITNVELGLKAELLDGSMRLNSSVFLMVQKDLQVRKLEGTVVTTTNAGEAEIKGLELEVMLLPIDELSLGLKYTYLDAVFIDFFDGQNDYSGNRLSRTPEHSFVLNIAYDIESPFGMNGLLSLESDYSWNDSRFEDNSNEAPEVIAAYGLLDARIVYDFDNWQFSAWAKNITDEEFETHYIKFGNSSYITFGQSRTVGVTANWRF